MLWKLPCLDNNDIPRLGNYPSENKISGSSLCTRLVGSSDIHDRFNNFIVCGNLQQHHSEELNVLEGSGARRFAAAFHHQSDVQTDRMPPICSLLPSLHPAQHFATAEGASLSWRTVVRHM